MSALKNYWDIYTPSWSCGSLPSRNAALTKQVVGRVFEETSTAYAYRAIEGKTFCNLFALACSEALGCPMPRMHEEGNVWYENSANWLARWLAGPGVAEHGWSRCADMESAIKQANAGFPIMLAYLNPIGPHGHFGVGLSTPDDEKVIRVAACGIENLFDVPAGRSFSLDLPAARFYSHD